MGKCWEDCLPWFLPDASLLCSLSFSLLKSFSIENTSQAIIILDCCDSFVHWMPHIASLVFLEWWLLCCSFGRLYNPLSQTKKTRSNLLRLKLVHLTCFLLWHERTRSSNNHVHFWARNRISFLGNVLFPCKWLGTRNNFVQFSITY